MQNVKMHIELEKFKLILNDEKSKQISDYKNLEKKEDMV